MADTHKTHAETIADIIAEKRREANYIVQVSQGKCQTRRDKAEDEARDIRREADRLEAACKREMVELRKQVGNAAKLREALTKCYQLAYGWEANEREGIAGVEPGAKDSAETLLDIQQITTAALAAPPRNCDRFASAEEAWNAYDEWMESYRAQGKTEPFNEFGWLYAEAQEGGANG